MPPYTFLPVYQANRLHFLHRSPDRLPKALFRWSAQTSVENKDSWEPAQHIMKFPGEHLGSSSLARRHGAESSEVKSKELLT